MKPPINPSLASCGGCNCTASNLPYVCAPAYCIETGSYFWIYIFGIKYQVNYMSGLSEVDQPQPIWRWFIVEAEFSDSCTERTSLWGSGFKYPSGTNKIQSWSHDRHKQDHLVITWRENGIKRWMHKNGATFESQMCVEWYCPDEIPLLVNLARLFWAIAFFDGPDADFLFNFFFPLKYFQSNIEKHLYWVLEQ